MRLDNASLRVGDNLPDSCKADPGQKFSDDNDVFTRQLTASIVNKIGNLSQKRPYDQIAGFHRKYVDYNRCEECSFEPSSLLAKQAYLEYHNGILQKIEEMYPENESSLAFLFDIHGTGHESVQVGGQTYTFEVLIGTDEQRSIKALTDIDPNVWWDEDRGLIPLIEKKGIAVFPPDEDVEQQNRLLDGGYTIQTYGSSQYKKRLAAIQIEVIHDIRVDRNKRQKLGEDLADCILKFVSPFISQS